VDGRSARTGLRAALGDSRPELRSPLRLKRPQIATGVIGALLGRHCAPARPGARLLDYYVHTALASARRLPGASATGPAALGAPPGHAPGLATEAEAAAWLAAERSNLLAAAAHAATAAARRHPRGRPATLPTAAPVASRQCPDSATSRQPLSPDLGPPGEVAECDRRHFCRAELAGPRIVMADRDSPRRSRRSLVS